MRKEDFFGEEEKRKEAKPKETQSEIVSTESIKPAFSLDACLIVAQNAAAGFSPEFIQFAQKPGDELQIHGITPERTRLFGKFDTRLSFDEKGGLSNVFRAAEADAEYKAEHTLEELHFGQYGGWISKIFYALFTTATFIVTATGLWLWWKKR